MLPVANREMRNGRYFITALADPSPEDRLVLINGHKAISEIRTAVAKVPDKSEKTVATLSLRSAGGGVDRIPLDISWLKGAATTYHISPDPKDYVFVSLPIVTADVPNRNGDGFTYNELSNFSPVYGRFIYATFLSKACHQDHRNSDPTKAKGTHFDSTFRKYSIKPGNIGYSMNSEPLDMWKIRVLTGWDRTKDKELVKQILRRQRTAYSMGALIDYATCSLPWCGKVTTPKPCEHIGAGKGKVINGYVVYDLVHNVNFIETSSLGEEPADVDAFESEHVIDPRSFKRQGSVNKRNTKYYTEDLWRYNVEA